MLTKSTPEGARDYLVPSRVHAGEFFALPQSPQLFKQLLMIAGFDRYYQIVKCFRDEDLRADRQPEFTQIDVETSFLDETEIRALMEEMIRAVFDEVLGVKLPNPFPVMTYGDAMRAVRLRQAGPAREPRTDRRHRRGEGRRVQGVQGGRRDEGRPRRGAARFPRAARCRARRSTATPSSSRSTGQRASRTSRSTRRRRGATACRARSSRTCTTRALAAVVQRTGAKDGDVIFFGADRAKVVYDSLGALRTKIGHSEFGRAHGLSAEGWKPLWVIDFPMFEYDEEDNRYVAAHHPFTSPKEGHEDYLATDPAKALAKAYDMALNGWEIGGGSVRIHREDVQSKVFRALKIDADEAQLKFGFLLDALQYGAPPHGGIAFGLDRIVTMMAGAESIRDVIAFPKTQRAQCLLTQAPSAVDEKQLRELHIRLRNPEPKTAEPRFA